MVRSAPDAEHTWASGGRPTFEVVVADVAGRPFGFPVRDVDEVQRVALTTPLPGAPSVVEGVLDIGGEIVPVLDGRRHISAPLREVLLSDRLVVLRTPNRRVAVRVDAVTGIASAVASDVENAASLMPAALRAAGIARLDDGLLVVHDVMGFLSADELAAIEASIAELEHGG